MKLEAVINGCEQIKASVAVPLNVEVSGVVYDSRKVSKGSMFVAIKGEHVDGHDFIDEAITRGAVAIVHEKPLDTKNIADKAISELVLISTGDSRKTLACIANNFFNRPSERLMVVGITGTNGKTTTAYLVRSVFKAWKKVSGLIGTISCLIKDLEYPAANTTPEAPDFQGLLREMEGAGCTHVVTEVSSHALSQHRVDYTSFEVAVFTNLTRDHLDFHGTMEVYYYAKKRLFSELLRQTGTAVIYIDDAWGRRLYMELSEETAGNKLKILTYGLDSAADIRAQDIENSLSGVSFVLHYRDKFFRIASPLVGTVNVCNILAAAAVALALDIPMEVIAEGVRNIVPVKGRLERINEGQDFLCLVDYAHTPDALERLILTARGLLGQETTNAECEMQNTEFKNSNLSKANGFPRIITVFGCGGNRDHGKRPVMGELAARLSDYVIITSDNPRQEDPLSIIKEIEAGITTGNHIEVPGRRSAITMAVEKAGRGDIVIIAGKGHEDYQETGNQRCSFSDGDVAREAIRGKLRSLAGQEGGWKVQEKLVGDLTIKDIVKATGGRLVCGGTDETVVAGVSIDSRTIKEGELFVAIKGERYDGHAFLSEVLKKAGGAVVSNLLPEGFKGKVIIQVEDTLKALQNMAHYNRIKRDVAVIGVTGTNGKTTTKEMIASILSIRLRGLKNPGNFNNYLGLPLSLLKLKEEDEFAVLEMGASRRGDIKELCDIALPDYGVITNIGAAHLESFGSVDAVLSTKLELFEEAKTVSVNADDKFLMEGVRRRLQGTEYGIKKKVVTFGIDNNADIFARDIRQGDRYTVFNLCLGSSACIEIRLNIPGRFNIYNALAAASICRELGTGLPDIKRGLEAFAGVPMRLEFREMYGATLINDIYNANPASMEGAVKELLRLKKKRAIAVLGDMLELGAYSEAEHRKLGQWMSGLPLDIFIAVGPRMSKAAEEFSKGKGRVITVSDAFEAGDTLPGICHAGDTILIKGSRGMHMERAVGKHEPDRHNQERGVA